MSMLVAQAGHDQAPARPFALFVEWQALVVVYLSQMGALAFALVFLDAFITCTCLACGNWLVSDASTRMD